MDGLYGIRIGSIHGECKQCIRFLVALWRTCFTEVIIAPFQIRNSICRSVRERCQIFADELILHRICISCWICFPVKREFRICERHAIRRLFHQLYGASLPFVGLFNLHNGVSRCLIQDCFHCISGQLVSSRRDYFREPVMTKLQSFDGQLSCCVGLLIFVNVLVCAVRFLYCHIVVRTFQRLPAYCIVFRQPDGCGLFRVFRFHARADRIAVFIVLVFSDLKWDLRIIHVISGRSLCLLQVIAAPRKTGNGQGSVTACLAGIQRSVRCRIGAGGFA